jgi:hypothetical protein
MGKRYVGCGLILLAALIMLVVLAPRLYSLLMTGVFGGQTLSFDTVAQGGALRGSPSQYDNRPTIWVIASAQEIDTILRQMAGSPTNIEPSPVQKLRQLDYTHFFAIIVLQGSKRAGDGVLVQQISRQENRVRVGATFTSSWPFQGAPGVIADPYHIIAVAKEGAWGQPIDFELFVGGQVVARTTHVIP